MKWISMSSACGRNWDRTAVHCQRSPAEAARVAVMAAMAAMVLAEMMVTALAKMVAAATTVGDLEAASMALRAAV